MNEVAWLFLAFLAVWIVIGTYLYSLGARQRRLEQRVKSLDSPRD
jgi:CcmD family protein